MLHRNVLSRRAREHVSRLSCALFAVLMLLLIVDWAGSFTGPTWQRIVEDMSLLGHLDDFIRGVIDTHNVVYYLSVITFGLFLTAKAVDSERWRG